MIRSLFLNKDARLSLIVVILSMTLASCGNASAPKVIPGAGGAHLYDLMDEDSTEVKADSVVIEKTDK